jgi:RNA polymerase sigma-70 factor (ECF subfamily)
VATDIAAAQRAAHRHHPGEGERRLVSAAQRGDAEAFRDLYRAYRDPIWGLVVSLVGDSHQAQDVLQNVFFKAFKGLGGFRFQSGLFTWLYRIARNECRNYLRRRDGPHVPLEAIIGRFEEIDGTRASEREEERRAVLRNAVKQLPFKMREVVILKYQEDLSYSEMSRILGCPPGTVASRLNRALLELEARLRPPEGLP